MLLRSGAVPCPVQDSGSVTIDRPWGRDFRLLPELQPEESCVAESAPLLTQAPHMGDIRLAVSFRLFPEMSTPNTVTVMGQMILEVV